MDWWLPSPLNQHTPIPTNMLTETEIDWPRGALQYKFVGRGGAAQFFSMVIGRGERVT